MNDTAFVCSYFNYCGYEALKRNLLTFQQQFDPSTRLVTVECAFFDKPFEIEGAIQVRSNSVMFQKERLLTIGAEKLIAEGYKKIIFCDADVIFETPDYLERLSKALDTAKVIQGFSKCEMHFGDCIRKGWSSIRKFIQIERNTITENNGLVWGVRSEVLEQCPIYQHSILGNGDTCLLMGAVKKLMSSKHWQAQCESKPVFRDNPAVREYYTAWANRFSELVGDAVGFPEGVFVRSLLHGTIKARQYNDRHELLKGFDPATDVSYEQGKAFEWASDKPEMHERIKGYFDSRKD